MSVTSEKGPDDEAERAAPAVTPSRSARKRAAEAAQRLGEELIELDDAELAALALPEPLIDALREARRIASRSAGARHRQYIGRLMRSLDLEGVRAALAARRAQGALEARRLHRLEAWRDRLIESDAALAELARIHPRVDRGEWQPAIAAARAERDQSRPASGARRRLLRMLRGLFARTDTEV